LEENAERDIDLQMGSECDENMEYEATDGSEDDLADRVDAIRQPKQSCESHWNND
jgi:hypothetical protein